MNLPSLIPPAGGPPRLPEVFSRCRVAVVEQIFHQVRGKQPLEVACRSNNWLATDEQPYQRQLTLGPNWVPADTGWLKDGYSLLIVQNEQGRDRQVIPTPEEKRDNDARVIEVCILPNGAPASAAVPMFRVRPLRMERFAPVAAFRGGVYLRCARESAPVILTALPL